MQKTDPVKFIALGLLITLLINPVIIYIITDQVFLSSLCTLAALLFGLTSFLHRRLHFLTSYLISFLTSVSILLHAEAIFVSNFKEYIIEDLYNFEHKYYFNRPYLNKTFHDKEFAVTYRTTKQGFRIGAEENQDTEITACDWLFIGDSYTQGAQVEFENLFTTILYKSFPDKIIVNSGISGWGLPEEYNYYINAGSALKPKKVFLQVCNFNDFMNVHEKDASFTDLLMNKSQFLRFLLYPFKYANPTELPLGRWTEPFYPTVEANQDFNIFFKEKSQRQKKDLANFKSFITKLNDAVKANGAELIIFQIPTKEQLYYKYFEEVVKSFKIEVDQLDMRFPNEFLRAICEQESIKHIDLYDRFSRDEHELFFQFDEHLNSSGHQRIADVLASFIEQHFIDNDRRSELLSDYNTEDRYPVFLAKNLITYQSIRDSNIELFAADSLLENEKRITFNNVDELHPWIDMSRQKLLFTEGDQATGRTKVVSMNLNGSNRSVVTDDGFYGAIPSTNDLNNKIAYPEWTLGVDGKLTNPVIVVLNLKENDKRIITSDHHESWRPIFSPNDSLLFYISKRELNNFDIYCYDLANNKEINLTQTSFDEWDPFISPDGRKLVYAGFKDGNWDIFLLDLLTKKTTQLTKTLGDEWDTSFSPDGRYVYYAGVYGFMNGIYRIRL